ncbi:MAG: ABC transporter transmembrane domain-containing protein [Actinomycetota bacterium]
MPPSCIRTRWLLERLLTRRVLDPAGFVPKGDTGSADPGRLLSLATSDASRVGGIADLMCRGSGALVSFLAVGIGMLYASPLLGMLVLLGLPPCMLILAPLWRPYEEQAAAQQASLAAASSVASDAVAGLRVVKGLGAEPQVRKWFGDASIRCAKQE